MSQAYVFNSAEQIKEITGAIYGLAGILEDDACRDADDGEQAVLCRFDKGSINLAIKQLALRASDLAERIEERSHE